MCIDNNIDINAIYSDISNVPNITIDSFDPKKTAIVVIDMVNGFVKGGAMASPRIDTIVEPIAHLCTIVNSKDIEIIALCDCHDKNSPEFSSYPIHCLKGTWESEVIDEIKGYKRINKETTNGFIEEEFKLWLKNNSNIENYILVGDCTDICVMQLALSMATHFTKFSQNKKIFVPSNMVETYDSVDHNGDAMQLFSLITMKNAGINIIKLCL